MAAGGKKANDVCMSIKKLGAAVSLLSFVVLIVAGIAHGMSVEVITFRAACVCIIIMTVIWVVVKILAKYEEMSSG